MKLIKVTQVSCVLCQIGDLYYRQYYGHTVLEDDQDGPGNLHTNDQECQVQDYHKNLAGNGCCIDRLLHEFPSNEIVFSHLE